MNEDEKMFRIGSVMLILMMVVTAGLQVCYRTQNTERRRVRAQIVQTQQKIAAAQADFASLVRPESLRNLVSGVVARVETVGFHKSVDIQSLPTRTDEQ